MAEWLAANWQVASDAFAGGHYFSALASPMGILISVGLVLVAAAIPRFRKNLLLFTFGMWGYVTTYHFTLEGKNVELLGYDAANSVTSTGQLALFLFGFVVVSGVILYFVFVRSD